MSIFRGLIKINIVLHSGARDKEEVWSRTWSYPLESEEGSVEGDSQGRGVIREVKKGDATRSGPGQQSLCCRPVP